LPTFLDIYKRFKHVVEHYIIEGLQNAKILPFDDTSKFILFSDCHRGEYSFANDFANNRNIYFHALKFYFIEDFQYLELGNSDELWENINFEVVFTAHKHIYF
jgi:hypothetical protein